MVVIEGGREGVGHVEVLGIDHLELWVGDAAAAARRLRATFGFHPIARSRAESVTRYVVGNDAVRLVLTSSTDPRSAVHERVRRLGDGIRDVAFRVADVERAYGAALARGARPVEAPTRERDEHGEVQRATICAFGSAVHSFVTRDGYAGPHAPGFLPWRPSDGAPAQRDPEMLEIDHVNMALPAGATEAWLAYYRDIFGLTEVQRFDSAELSTARTALSSRVLQDPAGRFLLPSAEPVPGRPGHIDRGLAAHEGAYFQHVAIRCADLAASVRALRARGARFMTVPDAYYRDLRHRVDITEAELTAFTELQILVDEDREGRLLQIFSEHIANEVWLEYIERRGSRSNLGERNIKALALAAELHESAPSPRPEA